jgi:hypothetical protein
MIVELEREHPNIKASMINALGNVRPRHLLDRRLNPLTEAIAEREPPFDLPAIVPLTTRS